MIHFKLEPKACLHDSGAWVYPPGSSKMLSSRQTKLGLRDSDIKVTH